jgi:hypothetical protein
MVKRIVANIKTDDLTKGNLFYQDILELEVLMDHGWIKTLGTDEKAKVQISFAEQGGNNTEVPDLSIEVDNIEEIYAKMKKQALKSFMILRMKIGKCVVFL